MFRYHGTVFIYVFIYNFLFKIIFLFLFTNLLSSKKPRRSRPPLWNQGCWAFRPPAFLFLPTAAAPPTHTHHLLLLLLTFIVLPESRRGLEQTQRLSRLFEVHLPSSPHVYWGPCARACRELVRFTQFGYARMSSAGSSTPSTTTPTSRSGATPSSRSCATPSSTASPSRTSAYSSAAATQGCEK